MSVKIKSGLSLRTVVAPHERAFEVKNRAVQDVLGPGVYWTVPFLTSDVLVFDITKPESQYGHMEALYSTRPELVNEYFAVADLSDNEAGLVYQNGKLTDILAPGTRTFYWKGVTSVVVEVVDLTDEYRVNDKVTRLIGRTGPVAVRAGLLKAVLGVDVRDQQVGLLFENGVLAEVLEPGYHLFWQFNRKLSAKVSDARWVTVDVVGQEILTKDRVSLRVNLSATYRITDPVLVEKSVSNVADYLYRELQLELRSAVGTRTLDELLADRTALDNKISAGVQSSFESVGVSVGNVGVKDIILPGDMKDILNQVVQAEKMAQANNIRRREETAATRSLMNTAKLMADNPLLVRLKELEALEKVTTNIDRITVFGGMEGVMNDLVKIDSGNS